MTQPRSLVAVFVLLAATANAQTSTEEDASGFLNIDHDYVLRFSNGNNPFSLSKTDTSSVSKSKKGVTIGPWTINFSVSVFSIIERKGESWVLVEHPADIKKAFEWNAKRLAIAALNEATIARLQASDKGRDKLEDLRKTAAVKVETARTWINLRHVVAIQSPPTTPLEMKLNIKVTQN